MKTYVVHRCNTIATSRREIREPIDRDLNERPRLLHTAYDMSNMLNVTAVRPTEDYMTQTHMTMTRVVMETHRVITMQWIEVEERDLISYGYYNRFVSYYQMPTDVSSNDMFEIAEGEDINTRLGTVSHRMTEEQFYRHRITELEQQVRLYEEKNRPEPEPIVTPEPPRHFDDEIFEWSETDNEM